ALIADAHIGGPGGSAGPLLDQLAALPGQGCKHLILMGDLFQAWIGSPRFETPDIRAVVEKLRELRKGGLRIDYVEGNRDFFLKDSPYADAFDSVVLEVAFEAGGKRYLAVHGDGLNDRDWQYLFWRRLSKSPPVRFAVFHTPKALAHRMVHSTEQRLSKTNFKHKANVPEEPIRRYAERRFAEGHDVLLLGHFHEPRTWTVKGGEVRLLDAWFRSRQVEWLGNSEGAKPV
ncbi:MAG TPA: UDP-2,3-diacylglucosamine diphosphatase, partial [Thermoanaerobaculia bacterium]|nr:UDP-2,3-diacylglucosamine diphosphatase [Thermoanaerobaculia bacterium]